MKRKLLNIALYIALVLLAVNFGMAAIQTPALFVMLKLYTPMDAAAARMIAVAVQCLSVLGGWYWCLRNKFYVSKVSTFAFIYVGMAVFTLLVKLGL